MDTRNHSECVMLVSQSWEPSDPVLEVRKTTSPASILDLDKIQIFPEPPVYGRNKFHEYVTKTGANTGP